MQLNMQRLHIVGCPRSGTTLLIELVSTCFANSGHCAHEISVFEPVPVTTGVYITKQPNDIRQVHHIFHRDETPLWYTEGDGEMLHAQKRVCRC